MRSHVSLCVSVEFHITFVTVRSGWSIAYIEGSRVINLKKLFLSLKIDFVLAYRADPDEMPHYAAFHLGLRWLTKFPFVGFYSIIGQSYPATVGI